MTATATKATKRTRSGFPVKVSGSGTGVAAQGKSLARASVDRVPWCQECWSSKSWWWCVSEGRTEDRMVAHHDNLGHDQPKFSAKRTDKRLLHATPRTLVGLAGSG
jgi:hypothetical protein